MNQLAITRRLQARTFGAALLVGIAAAPTIAIADEGGVSFWLPGQFGSLAAVPQQPGWTFADVYYHTSVSASGNVAAAREITIGRFSPTVTASLNANLNSRVDLDESIGCNYGRRCKIAESPRSRNVNSANLQHLNVGQKCGGNPTLRQAVTFLPISPLLGSQPSFSAVT